MHWAREQTRLVVGFSTMHAEAEKKSTWSNLVPDKSGQSWNGKRLLEPKSNHIDFRVYLAMSCRASGVKRGRRSRGRLGQIQSVRSKGKS